MVGLLGSIRTSSISLEWGTTKPPGLSFGGGRRSSPTSSSVSGAPTLVDARILGESLTAWFWSSASTTLLTSLRASTAVAAPEIRITPIAPSSTRLAIHQGRRAGSGWIASAGGPPTGGGMVGGWVTVLKRETPTIPRSGSPRSGRGERWRPKR